MWIETRLLPHYLSRRQRDYSIRSKRPTEPQVTIEEVNRVLDIGRLLFSVMTEEEKEELDLLLKASSSEAEIGNTGVT